MDIAALALTAIGTIGSTISNIQQAKGQAAAAKAEAASIAEQSAFEEQQYRRKALIQIGQQRATEAASGVDISSGSPLFAELDSARQAELNALNIRRQGQAGIASKTFEAKMAQSRIPGLALGGAANLGTGLATSSILGQWVNQPNWRPARPAPYRY